MDRKALIVVVVLLFALIPTLSPEIRFAHAFTPTIVQVAKGQSATATVKANLTSTISLGDIILVELGGLPNNSPATVLSVTDNRGNSYTYVNSAYNGGPSAWLYYAPVTTAGASDNITVVLNYPASLSYDLFVTEVATQGGGIGVTSMNTGASGVPSVASFTPTANSTVFAFEVQNGGTSTYTAGQYLTVSQSYATASPMADEYNMSWASGYSTTCTLTPSTTSAAWAEIAVTLYSGSTYVVNVYEEENPTQLNTYPAGIIVSVTDNYGNTQLFNTTTGTFNFTSVTTPASITVVATGVAYPRVYQDGGIITAGNIINLYYPYYLTLMQNYNIYLVEFASAPVITVYPLNSAIILSRMQLGGTAVGVPLLYGHPYTITITDSMGTYTYSVTAAGLTTFGLAPPISSSNSTYGLTFSATYNVAGSYVTVYYSDPTGAITSGTVNILDKTGATLATASINASTWAGNIVLAYQPGMSAFYSVLGGTKTGYAAVVNSTYASNSFMPTFLFPDIGLGSVFGTYGGFTDGDNGWYTLFSVFAIIVTVSLFSEKHQQLAAMAAVLEAAFFGFLWVPLLAIFVPYAIFIAAMMFVERGQAPY